MSDSGAGKTIASRDVANLGSVSPITTLAGRSDPATERRRQKHPRKQRLKVLVFCNGPKEQEESSGGDTGT